MSAAVLRSITKPLRACEIAERCGLPAAAVRLHLLRLKTAGRVNSMRVRRADGSGWERWVIWYRR